jgi:hypothetical protein
MMHSPNRGSGSLRDSRKELMSGLVSCDWKLELETGNWKLETGNWKLETGNWKLETGNWKLETGNWKLETGKKYHTRTSTGQA